MFKDKALIIIRSGKGGDGAVSFKRELFIPNGGPDGGDGGKGGDLIVEVDRGIDDLSFFKKNKRYSAFDGENGSGNRRHGKSGADLILKVPEGTVIRDEKSKKIIADMSADTLREVILKGGRGGRGNQHFATSSMQAPRYAEPGEKAREQSIILELKLIADAGLVGMPNAGKSTLLSRVSNARPKIANYPFTTISPYLGVVDIDSDSSFVMADIPGLIRGASKGEGLGHEFLRHIERCRMLIYVLDIAGTEGRDPLSDIKIISDELISFNPALGSLPYIIAANKIDCMSEESDNLKRLKERYRFVYPISALTGEGIKDLIFAAKNMLKDIPKKEQYKREYFYDEEPLSQISVYKESGGVYRVDGEKIERMLGYTNLDTEKGFDFFQKFMHENGIIERLLLLGLKEGDTVKVGEREFSYYE